VSVLSRKRAAEGEATGTRGRGQQPVWLIVQARAAVPMAKTAGLAARDGARSAATWAAPRVNGARAWTAPRIERGGLAIKDTVAPKIYDMLVVTARRVDVGASPADVTAPRRRGSRVMAGTAALAAAGAVVAVVLRRRKRDGTRGEPGHAAGVDADPQAAQEGRPGANPGATGTEPDAGGQSPAA
jgi:hypothetical protein